MATLERDFNVANNAGKTKLNAFMKGLGFRAVISAWGTYPGGVPTLTLNPTEIGVPDTSGGEVDVTSLASPQGVASGTTATLSDMGRFSDSVDWTTVAGGLSAGDYLFLKDTTGGIKTGVYEIEAVGVADGMATNQELRLLNPYRDDGQVLWPFQGAITSISWFVCWTLHIDTDNEDYFLADKPLEPDPPDSVWLFESHRSIQHTLVVKDGSDRYRMNFWLRDCDDGDLCWLDGTPWTGFETTKQDEDNLRLSVTNSKGMKNGGVGTVQIVSGTDIYWDSGHTKQDEITHHQAESLGVFLSAGTGSKSGTFRLRARRGDTIYRDVAVTVEVVTANAYQVNKEKA